MSKRALLFLAALPLLVVFWGCASATAGLAASNIPMDGKRYRVLGPAAAMQRWCAFDIGVIALPLKQPPVHEVVKELLAAHGGGDALINMRFWTDRSIFFFITCHRFHVSAEVVKLLE